MGRTPLTHRCGAIEPRRRRSAQAPSRVGDGRPATGAGAGRGGRPRGGARLARLADLGLGAGRHAARLRIRAALPRPGARPRPRPAPDRAARSAAGSPDSRGAARLRSRHRANEAGRAPDARSGAGVGAGPGLRSASRCSFCSPRSPSATRSSATTWRTATRTRPSPTPGLDAAFKWARDVSGARIATTSTRQYPLFGTDLSNRVAYLGIDRPHGGFEEIETCRAWREALDARRLRLRGHHLRPHRTRQPAVPAPGRLDRSPPGAEVVLEKPPTVVFKLTGPLDPSACS